MSVSKAFENQFVEIDLATAVEGCARSELTDLLNDVLPSKQPVLEAGCGSGKWMHYLKTRGIEAVGIDWSESLQQRSQRFDSSVQFDVGDLRALPYPDKAFGSVLAFGSIEHVIEGPGAILDEFRRVLRRDGVAVITVPYMSLAKRAEDWLKGRGALRENARIRSLLRKQPVRPGSWADVISKGYDAGIHMDVLIDRGEYSFYQYAFTKTQLRSLLESHRFTVEKISTFGVSYGIWRASRGLGGKRDAEREVVHLNVAGRALAGALPARVFAHMLCALARVQA